MLSVIGIWIYMLFTAFLAGYGTMCAVMRFIPYRVRHWDSYLVCGLAVATVYAQSASLLGRVGLAANLVLCITCAAIAWHGRRALGGMFQKVWNGIRTNQSGERGKVLAALFLFLLFAYGTSRGIIHYDTGLYHAQSIRWIEEYGVVKGLGNLHCRLAYNSSSFALSALYSMAFLGGQSFHCTAGFLAFLLAKVSAEAAGQLRKKRLRASGFARVMCGYYLVNIFDEMVSPASDYFMVLLAFYIVIRFLDLLEHEVGETFPYVMLCILGVFLMTVKLSAALILLLVCYPAYDLVHGKRWKETGVYLALGLITALPFFIRNVVLSGWLVYPFTQIDLFDVAWKIPKGMADYDAREIQVWGRGYTDVARYHISMGEWIPDWFRSLAGSDKLLVAAAALSVCALLVYGIGMFCRLWERRWGILLVQITVAASFLFWLCTSPLIRYGCVYVYLLPAVVFGGIYDAALRAMEARADGEAGLCGMYQDNARQEKGTEKKMARRIAGLCGILPVYFLVGYKCAAFGGEIAGSFVNDYWVVQKDYENYPVLPYEIGGVTFYYPAQGDQVGYEAFPSSPVKAEAELIGEDVGEGFAYPVE